MPVSYARTVPEEIGERESARTRVCARQREREREKRKKEKEKETI